MPNKAVTVTATFTLKDVLTGITVEGPTKTEYVVGQPFNSAGLVVKAQYTVSAEKTLNSSEYSFTPPDTSTVGEKKVTVSYEGETAEFTITVIAKTVTAFTVTGTLDNPSQYIGETLSTAGLTFKVTYNDKTTEDVTSGITFTSASLDSTLKFTKLGSASVTAAYSGKTVSFNVTVIEHQVTKLEFTGTLTKSVYAKDEVFSPAGLTFTATYDDNSTKAIAASDITFAAEGLSAGGKLTAYGTIEITASYKGATAATKITVSVNAPDTLVVGSWYLLGTFNEWGANDNTAQYIVTVSTSGTGDNKVTTYAISNITLKADDTLKVAKYAGKSGTTNTFADYKNSVGGVSVNPTTALLTASVITTADANYGNVKISAVNVKDRGWNITVTEDKSGIKTDITLYNYIDWRDPTDGSHDSSLSASTSKAGDYELRGNFTNNFNSSDAWSTRNSDLVTKIGNVYYFENVYLKAYDSFKVVKVGTTDTWLGINETFAIGKALTLANRNTADTADAGNIYVGAIADGKYNLVLDTATNKFTVYAAKELNVALKDGVTVKAGETLTKDKLTVTYGGTAVTEYALTAEKAVQGPNELTVIYNGAITVIHYNAVGEFSVTYNKHTSYDVVGMPTDIPSILENEKITKPADPTLKGFTFDGWYSDDALQVPWNFDTDTVTSAVTLYAKWTAKKYNIDYMTNGGASSVNPKMYTASENGTFEPVTLNPANKGSNYTFDGWFTANEGGDKVTALGYDILPADGDRVTLYARFTPITYTIEYNFGTGGYTAEFADNTAPTSFTFDGEAATLPVSAKIIITPNAFNFVGWYVKGDASKTKITAIDNSLVSGKTFENNVIVVVADIEAKPVYDVIFNYNYDGAPAAKTENVIDGEKVTKPADPTRTGYTFAGWCIDAEGTSAYNFDTLVKADDDLFAKWTVKDYVVEYNYSVEGGATTNPTTFTIESADFTLTAATTTAAGYYFVGWYTALSGGNEVTALSAGMIDADTDKIVLYAIFSNVYDITFDDDVEDGVTVVGMPSDMTAAYGSTFSVAAIPTRDDYTFSHWKFNGAKWNFDVDTVAGDMTLVAAWTENPDDGYYFLTGDDKVGSDTFVCKIGEDGTIASAVYAVGDKIKLVKYTKKTGEATDINIAYISTPNGAITLDGTPAEYTVKANKYADTTYTVTVHGVNATASTVTFTLDGYNCYRGMDGNTIASPTEVAEPSADTAYIVGNFTSGKTIVEWSSAYAQKVTRSDGSVGIYFTNVTLKADDAFRVCYKGTEKAYTVTADGSYNIEVLPSASELYPYAALTVATVAEKPIYVGHEVLPENLNVTYDSVALTADYEIVAAEAVSGTNTVTVIHRGSVVTINYTATENVVTAIVIDNEPTKLNYFAGDELVLDGLTLTLTYADGSTKVVNGTDADIADYVTFSSVPTVGNTTLLGNKKTCEITVTAKNTEVSAKFNINVYNKATSIVVTKNPRTDYVESQKLDLSGMEVTVYYNDGETYFEKITNANYTTDPANGTAVSNISKVIVKYERTMGDTGLAMQTLTTELNITVTPKEIKSIAIINKPEKIEYFVGDKVDLQGLNIKVVYNDDTEATVEYSDLNADKFTVTYANGEYLTVDDTSYVIKYGGQTVTVEGITVQGFTVTCNANILYDTKNAIYPGKWQDEYLVQVYNQSLEITNPIRGEEGTEYKFGGWYTDKECTEAWGVTGDASTVGNVTSSMTLYAKWIAQADGGDNVEVKYNKFSPDAATATVKYYAVDFAIALEAPTAAGYTFVGWFTDENCTVPFDTETYTVWKEHTELYGKWTSVSYIVRYVVPDGVTHENSTSYSAEDGDVALVAPTVPAGIEFNFWSTVENDVKGDHKVTAINVALFAGGDTVTLYAICNEITYGVTYYDNYVGGSYQAKTVEYGGKADATVKPTTERELFRFDGWYTEAECTNKYDFTKVLSGNVQLYAKWTELFPVNFIDDKNGTDVGIRVAVGEIIPAKDRPANPTFAGFGFGGWLVDGTTTVWDFDEDKVTGALVLRANWIAEVSVTFLMEKDGAEYHKVTGITPGNTVGSEKMPEDPKKDGYNFVKWVDAGGKDFTADTVVNADTVVYADWQEIKVTVTFNANGGKIGENATTKVELKKGTPIGDKKPADKDVTRDGYRFLGWFVVDGETETEYKNFDANVDADLTLTAKWVQVFTVTFSWNYEGAPDNGVITTQTVDKDGYATRPETNPVRDPDKFTFNEWFVDAAGETEFDFAKTKITKATTVYAKWTALSQGVMEVTSGGKTETKRMLDNSEASKYDEEYAFFGGNKVALKSGDILKFKVEGKAVSFTLTDTSSGIEKKSGTLTSLTVTADGDFEIYMHRNGAATTWEIHISDGKVDEKPAGVVEMKSTGVYLTGTMKGVASGWGHGLELAKTTDQYQIEKVELSKGDTVKIRLGTNDGVGSTTLTTTGLTQLVVGSRDYEIKADGLFSFYVKVNNMDDPTSVTAVYVTYSASMGGDEPDPVTLAVGKYLVLGDAKPVAANKFETITADTAENMTEQYKIDFEISESTVISLWNQTTTTSGSAIGINELYINGSKQTVSGGKCTIPTGKYTIYYKVYTNWVRLDLVKATVIDETVVDVPANAGKSQITFKDGTVTVYLKKGNDWVTTANLGSYNLYMWSDSLGNTEYFGSWSGTKMSATMKAKNADATVGGASFIINWTGGQTGDLSGMVAGGTYLITLDTNKVEKITPRT